VAADRIEDDDEDEDDSEASPAGGGRIDPTTSIFVHFRLLERRIPHIKR